MESEPEHAEVPVASLRAGRLAEGTWQALRDPVASLEIATAVYIGAPVLLFVFGWLRLVYALPLAAATIALLGVYGKRAWASSRSNLAVSVAVPAWQRWAHALGIVAITVFLVACTGMGAFTFQFADYFLYDGQLRGLIEHRWPVGVVIEQDGAAFEQPAVSYFAYYLPAAFLGKFAGWNSAYLFHFFWNVFGVLLSITWFLRILQRIHIGYAVLFLMFGGLDLIGYLATAQLPDGGSIDWYDYASGTYWWSTGRGWQAHWQADFSLLSERGQDIMGGVFFRFYGPLSFLSDGPVHVLPAWVVLLTVVHDALRRKTIERLYFLTAFLPLMSMLTTFGTVPWLAVATWHTRGKGLFTLGNSIVGPCYVLLFWLYFRSTDSEIPTGWLWNFQNLGETWPYLILHYVVSFGVYLAVSPSFQASTLRPGRLWAYTAIGVIMLVPFYRMGMFSDFTTKASIPSGLVLLIVLATAVIEPAGKHAGRRRAALWVCLVLGAWGAFGIVHRALAFGFAYDPPPIDRVAVFNDKYDNPDAKMTFRKEAFFWTHVAKPLDFRAFPENPVTFDFMFDTANALDTTSWYFDAENRRSIGDGIELEVPAQSLLMRRDALDIPSQDVGTARLALDVVDSDGNPRAFQAVLLWVTQAELNEPGVDLMWPFQRWRAEVILPEPLPWKPLSANPYWRDTIRALAVYLEVDDAEEDERFTATLRRLQLFQR